MMKKMMPILLISMVLSNLGVDITYAQEKYKRDMISGNTKEISMELNKKVFEKSDEAILVNSESIIDGIVTTPLAYAKDAPIIPVEWKKIDKTTKDYIETLGVKKITIIGGLSAVSRTTERMLTEEMGIEVDRIYGVDRYETSMLIADEISKIKKFDSIILINSRAGYENGLGIYSYAAQNNIPIIWSDDNDFETSKEYIEENNIKDVYAIGDLENFTYKIENEIENGYKIKEINKSDTNTALVQNLQEGEFNEVYTINVEYGNRADVDEYISLGVVAAKQNIPILICSDSLTKPQDRFLDINDVGILKQIKYEINDYSVINSLTSKAFISSIILATLLIIMIVRAFVYKQKIDKNLF